MNDLTFGATLLFCFVALVATVVLETTTPTPQRPATAVARTHPAPEPVATASVKDCATVAQAPAADR